MKKGVQINTNQENMAKLLAMSGTEATWTASDSASMAEVAKITDDDKAMFRQVTGYNIFVAGTGVMIVDDDGNSPSEEASKPINELFMRLQYARSSGQEVDADWFHGVSKDIADWGGPAFPADWDSKADAWFDEMLKARQIAQEASEKTAPLISDGTANSTDTSKLGAAISAYGEAGRLGAPPAD